MGYVEQEPLILSGTIKENILFRSEIDSEDRLEESIRMVSLEDDLRQFPNGVETLVGEKGITLSGGQKARLSLARALYSDSDIYLLDDPLSAVDPIVASKLFSNCIQRLKAEGKTVLLVSHQIDYIFACDRAVIMEEGRITHDDPPSALKAKLL